MENKEIIKPLHNRYASSDRFTILSISMDTDKEKWLNALETDQLDWTELCDLKGVSSVVARQYRVTDVPVIYVIDPDGKIIAKNLHGKELEDFIVRKIEGN